MSSYWFDISFWTSLLAWVAFVGRISVVGGVSSSGSMCSVTLADALVLSENEDLVCSFRTQPKLDSHVVLPVFGSPD